MTTARVAAARVLLAIERGRTTLPAEIEIARRQLADERDRGLVLELVAGTLRWRAELDALLSACSERPLPDLDPRVRAALRLAAYQLRHLDRVPEHAVVHQAVETVRTLNFARAAGFVNAVLRSLLRQRDRIKLPERPAADGSPSAELAYLTTTLSHPEWLVARWLSRFPFDQVERWCQFNNQIPDVALRPIGAWSAADLTIALAEAGLEPKPGAFVRNAIRLPPGAFSRLPPDLRDACMAQEEASQIVAHVVGASAGDRVLDLCAAPGGKTATMHDDMMGRGTLVSADHRPARLRLLKATLSRAANSPEPMRIVGLDATRPLPFGPVFDKVLVDAPCSGLGTIARDPDVKWSRSADDLPVLAEAQRLMLSQAATAVRPNGRLIDATCSSEPDENEAVVDAFLEQNPEFSAVPASLGEAVIHGQELIDHRGFLRTWPFRDGLDAFFAAVLVRRGPA